jgi:hypothetical protein
MTSDRERQLQMMLYKLTAFEKHELALSSLIGDLEGLFDALDLQDEYWREGFWDSWGDLEVVYALALDMPSKATPRNNWVNYGVNLCRGAME